MYRRAPKETAVNKRGILVATLFSLLILGIPVLVDPSSASDIILHGDIGFIALLFIAVMVIVVVGRRMSARIDSSDRKSAFAFTATFFGLVLAVLFFGFAISWHNEARTEARIQQNGLRAMANVVRVYNGGCGRGSCSIYVEYAFTPPTETESVHGYAWIGSRNTDPHVAYARANKKIPIAYEVGHPEVSALNFNDDVFRLDHGEHDRSGVALLGKLFLGIFALVLAVMGLSLWLRPGKELKAD